jgi:multidrug efflux pump subunit AcrB
VRDAIMIGAVLAALVLLVFSKKLEGDADLPPRRAGVAVGNDCSALCAPHELLHHDPWWHGRAVGLIIDDAIVMIEQIVRRVRQISGTNGGVLAAAAEFSRPLAGSSAATVVVFVPLAFLGGVTGGFFGPLPLTVASSLIFSFLITWLAVPLAAERLVTGKEIQREDVGAVSRWIFARYRAFAGRLLARPVLAVVGVLPLLALGYIAFKGVGSGFMPAMDEGGFIIDYLSPPGTALSETDRLVRQVEAILAGSRDNIPPHRGRSRRRPCRAE